MLSRGFDGHCRSQRAGDGHLEGLPFASCLWIEGGFLVIKPELRSGQGTVGGYMSISLVVVYVHVYNLDGRTGSSKDRVFQSPMNFFS